ncbi:MAG: hypothetical protein HY758_10770 [Nitrospirae bacterium]|nr:hypothetical protein [Nitrospirota bacterium]
MSEQGKILDIAHISFLDMIKIMITQMGAASAKGTLMRNALSTVDKISEVDYPTFDDYLNAIENSTNPITQIEGKATHIKEGVFGLAKCPFADSIKNYNEVFKGLPPSYAEFTAEFNKPSPVAQKYRVGAGAGVSPFCSVHQPMRSAFGEKIKIGGKNIEVYQLGCKAGSGKKGFADEFIKASGVSKDVVDKTLDNHMCCYYIKILN